ncbi:hypothetical protein CF327_g2678 [Tilletia walkeri]|nr:hypothetical protein CF327_g2678 [Tilletia walkeri]
MTFQLTVQKRASKAKAGEARISATSSKFPITLTLPNSHPTLANLKHAIHAQVPKLHPSRQRISLSGKTITGDEKTLQSLGINEGTEVDLKDLGPQISWRTVFLIEYAGPIIIHPLFYFLAPTLHRSAPFEPSQVQTLALSLVVLHYIKREFETLFIHRFSNDTMPFFNVFKNSFHYWGLGGVFIAFFLYSPSTSRSALAKIAPSSPFALLNDQTYLLIGASIWVIAELGNLFSHLQLMWLRPKGTRVRKIPRGGAFELVTSPNYFFEITSWLALTFLTLSPAVGLFAIVGAVQMAAWADKKHRNYRKEFKDYPRNRKRMIPFIW